MQFSLHAMATGTFVPMLTDLSGVLDKGAAYAAEKSVDLLAAKLAPDMFPLPAQVKIACDHAEEATLRLSGGTFTRQADVDASFDAMQARIARTVAYVESVPASAFVEDRAFGIPLMGNMELHVNALQLLKDWHLPNFYFHIVTAYDILRHAGVVIGKQDYMAHIRPLIRAKT